ncbi:hypothetical protein [Polyangium spumosum]|uniref:Uncharacterized protein n=1 Tax=Polyangium spumosum TaxID=889282 RepID=A0A6N7Q3N3_9BACT|nr:hypothetical protein [Polyangium spumosum]MRG96914.1 hypothetical protein [Polyangium spumosum]
MRLLGSIAAILVLSACNGGAQPPDAPTGTGNTSEATPSGTPSATTPEQAAKPPAPTTTTPLANPPTTVGGTPAPTVNPTNEAAAASPTQPSGSCGGRTCGAGESCASYYGIAGPRGPMFHECVVRCRRGEPNDGCPSGKKCFTVADGPGDVCR